MRPIYSFFPAWSYLSSYLWSFPAWVYVRESNNFTAFKESLKFCWRRGYGELFWCTHILYRFPLLSIKPIWQLFKIESEVLLNLDIVMKKKLVLYQPLLRKYINFGTQLARRSVEVSPAFFENRKKVPWFCKKLPCLCASMG